MDANRPNGGKSPRSSATASVVPSIRRGRSRRPSESRWSCACRPRRDRRGWVAYRGSRAGWRTRCWRTGTCVEVAAGSCRRLQADASSTARGAGSAPPGPDCGLRSASLPSPRRLTRSGLPVHGPARFDLTWTRPASAGDEETDRSAAVKRHRTCSDPLRALGPEGTPPSSTSATSPKEPCSTRSSERT